MSHKAKQLTDKEARYLFMKHMAGIVKYWAQVDLSRHRFDPNESDVYHRLSGLMHSTLVALDGGAATLPQYLVVPCPHESNKQYAIDEGFDYYAPIPDSMKDLDIGSALHEEIHEYLRNEIKRPEGIRTFGDKMVESFPKSKPQPEIPTEITFCCNNNLLRGLFDDPDQCTPKQIVNEFVKLKYYWFEEKENSLYDMRDEAFAVCYAWARERIDLCRNDYNLVYVLGKFQREYFQPYFEQNDQI